MVQPELHPEDERRKVDGNPGEPHADAAPPRLPEAVEAPRDGGPGLFDPNAELLRQGDADSMALQTAPDHALTPTPDVLDVYPAPMPPTATTPVPGQHGIRLQQIQEELVAWVKTILSAAVYAVLIVTFGFQVARVEGLSMAPTLEDQDRLIVNKLVYRLGAPRRGDIVMLYYPINPEKSFVKRVIAEERDTVRIIDGRVYVNDVPMQDDYVPAEYRSHDDWGPQVIPDGYYFVMGDHRNNSSDSRHWGMVPKRYIIGKVQLRWWPVPAARVF